MRKPKKQLLKAGICPRCGKGEIARHGVGIQVLKCSLCNWSKAVKSKRKKKY